MAFGGSSEKRVTCQAGHSVRQDRLYYHLVKHGCNGGPKFNPEGKVMYHANKQQRKEERRLLVQTFKAEIGKAEEADAVGESTESWDGKAGTETDTLVDLAPPEPKPKSPAKTALLLTTQPYESDDEDDWGQPVYPVPAKLPLYPGPMPSKTAPKAQPLHQSAAFNAIEPGPSMPGMGGMGGVGMGGMGGVGMGGVGVEPVRGRGVGEECPDVARPFGIGRGLRPR